MSSTAYEPLKPGANGATTFDVESAIPKHHDEELVEFGGQYTKKFAVGQVTIRLPEYNVVNWIAILYGFLPFIVPAMLFLLWVVEGRLVGGFGFAMSMVCVVANELVLKPLVRAPRPSQSANKNADGSMKPGMPSGHVLNSTTLMVWSLLEVSHQLGRAQQLKDARAREAAVEFEYEWLAVILVVMLPVPWARWHNRDHSLAQCCVSGVLGAVVGAAGFFVRKQYCSGEVAPWSF